ncbi:hypothetical protein A2U01_0058522, partial [Trifolium medium]|nr:hypothetical protein [Trifolium medium]
MSSLKGGKDAFSLSGPSYWWQSNALGFLGSS